MNFRLTIWIKKMLLKSSKEKWMTYLKNLILYMFMLIFLKNLDQHLKHLEKFIDLCISNEIGLSRKKTIIGEPKIDFLGLIIDYEE